MKNKFLIIPAIDLKDNCCVRLYQWDYSKEPIYSKNPVDMAKLWQDQGAKLIHIVDLDGAKQGKIIHYDILKKIRKSVDIQLEFGGGIRNDDDVNKLIDIDLHYCVLGTKALNDEDFLLKTKEKLKDRLVIGIDAKNGQVAIRGWLNMSSTTAMDLAKSVDQLGIKRMIYTDISVDGTLQGPCIDGTKKILDNTKNILVTISGGVSCYQDIEKIKEMKQERIFGVIIGRALYEKKVELKKMVEMYQIC